MSALTAILVTAAMLGAIGGTVVLTDTPSPPSDGLDSSGLPRPSG
ncbi:hypothetical protein ACWF0M_37970 [Kribbella sp. NPDC055110]